MKHNLGNLADTGMPRLLHLIFERGESAVLEVARDPVRKTFYFRDGVPVAAASNILGEVLGRLLIQEGLLTQKEYEDSLEVVLKEKRRHGEVLISLGLITAEQLEGFLTLQLKRRIWKVFSWNEGTYRYSRLDAAPGAVISRPPHPASLILEGLSLGFYPAQRIKMDLKALLEEPLSLAPSTARYSLEDFRLTAHEKRFASSLDGRRTLREALDSTEILRPRAEAIALSLSVTGLLRSEGVLIVEPELILEEPETLSHREEPWEMRLNAELHFMRARDAIDKGDYGYAIETLKRITDLNPAEAEYWAYLGWAIYRSDPMRLSEAETIIKDSIDLNGELDCAWYFLGMIFLDKGDEPWAEKALRTALSKNPWMIEALAGLKRLEAERLKPPPSPGIDRSFISVYGFHKDPFPLSFSTDSSLNQAQEPVCDSLVKAIRKRLSPILVSCAQGTGKTVVLLEALRRLSSDKVLASVILRPPEKEIQLIRAINSEIGAPADSASVKEQILSLGMRVSQNKIQGGLSVIFIDEAHFLTDGCLKLLQHLSRLKTVQIALFGELSIEERLKMTEFSELGSKLTPSTRLTISPLSKDEERSFILSRLNAERSIPGQFSLEEEAFSLIHTVTGGMPSRLNPVLCAALSKASRRKEFTLRRSHIIETPAEEAQARPVAPEPAPVEPAAIAGGPPPLQASAEATPAKFEVALPKEEPPAPPAAPVEPPPADLPGEPKDAPAAPVDPYSGYEEIPATPPKRGLGRVVLTIVLLAVLGLAIGALIGIYFFAPPPPPPIPIPKG